MFSNKVCTQNQVMIDDRLVTMTQEEMEATINKFEETLVTLRDLRMHLILDIYLEEVIRIEIENKIKDEYTGELASFYIYSGKSKQETSGSFEKWSCGQSGL